MCGIAGIIQTTPVQNSHRLQQMTESLAHRGPDGQQYWHSENGLALLGHRRLSIIDLSPAAAQPMHFYPSGNLSSGNRYSIVHNGELYNYIELKKELQNAGYTFHTQSDTEVILAAYAHWNDECVEYFDGMFAFAIWDEQEQELFAARDRFGEKPFFYHQRSGSFFFASEMKALWAGGIEKTPNKKMLFNYLTIGYTDNPARPEETFYEHVYKLPPASRLYFSAITGELDIEKYWELDPGEENTLLKPDEAIEKFHHLLKASVKRRLRSDVPVGISLSGGLDSSAIAAIIRQVDPARSCNAFTGIFPGFEKDEAAIAAEVAGHFGMPHHTVAITADDLANDWQAFVHHQEEPAGSASAFAQFKVYELAKQKNITVLLDGQGADETMAGYRKYYKWYWQELFQKRRLLRSKELKAARANGITETFGLKNIIAALLPELASVVLERQYLLNALRHEDLNRDFIRLQSQEAYYSTPPMPNLNGVLHFNTCVHGLEELLRYADRNAMAHGREVRLPFLDHELVTFIFSLPSSFKIQQGWTKWLLRTAMQNKLPDTITWRKDKIGFEPPQKEWMQHQHLREMVQEARKKMVQHQVLQPTVLDKPLNPAAAYDANAADWRYLSVAAYL